MKLKLKHLQIESGGKVDLSRGKFNAKNVDLKDCSLGYNSTTDEYYLTHGSVTYGMSNIKPHRRPMSDLTKPIEHNGEKFTPIDEFFILYGGGFKNKKAFLKTGFIDGILYSPYETYTYSLITKLFEWHFNVFNLPKELFVDIIH